MTLLNFYPPVIAHRGASAYAPENTLSAFREAALRGIKWVEFDVMQAHSGECVVFHDKELKRTTNGKGKLHKKSYEYLETLDAGSWFDFKFSGERIPTLIQVINFLKEADINANIELKASMGQERRLVEKVLADLTPFIADGKPTFLFSSFSFYTLQLLHKYAPNSLIGLLLHRWRRNWQLKCKALNCVALHVNEAIMTEEKASLIKKTGLSLLCYTVNDSQRANELYHFGVDAVFSDTPDKIVAGIAKPSL